MDNGKSGTVVVKRDLILSLKTTLDILIPRINWKSEEMFPMGVLVKQLTDILEKSEITLEAPKRSTVDSGQ